MRLKIASLSLLAIVLLAGCNPPAEIGRNPYWEENRYPQDFKTNVALLVIEWNGLKPHILASAHLADREKGIFYTAKHFTDAFGSLGPDYCKVFFNGKVFRARLIKVPPIRDAALIRLIQPFSMTGFLEPLLIAKDKPKLGDRIYIQGFHPHQYWIRKANEKEGFPDKVIPIIEEYYEQITRNLDKETQVVFDNLEGRVVKLDPRAVLRNPFTSDEEKEAALEYENDSYIKVRMVRDHKFSFGGLSGGAAVNEQGELIGIVTAQDIFRFEFDERGLFFDPHGNRGVIGEINQLFDTLYITPIDALKDLQQKVKEIK